ncbi:MAG: alpha/beta hydrolase family protein [Chthoniobacterales bacterium]
MSEKNPIEEIRVSSSLDGSKEPSLLYFPQKPEALLVALHTWSADRFNQLKTMLPFCQKKNWALLLPEFRGPNLVSNPRAPEAGGSALARRDIVDATEWVLKNRAAQKIPAFLLGGSGGGHMALMVAAREEFPWQAVSAWCTITDVAAWHDENPNYSPHIEAVCGGPPDSEKTAAEYRERSPLFHADALRRHFLQLAHGRQDASVPWTHSWKLAERLADSPKFYFSLFNGAHELHEAEAFAFFESTLRDTKEIQLSR